MFNKNYLGHNFDIYNIIKVITSVKYFCHTCSKCDMVIYYQENDNIYYIHRGPELKMTCDEYIIKNIIE